MATNDTPDTYLLPGERVLWSGKPAGGLRLQPSDSYMIPFSILWGGFAFFWEGSVLTRVPRTEPTGYFFAVWGIPFVLIGLYMMIGRFFDDAWLRRNTDYAVTDRRALILAGRFSRTLVALDLKNLPAITLLLRKDGRGSLTFGPQATYGFANRSAPKAPAFEFIDDPKSVMAIIENARSRR